MENIQLWSSGGGVQSAAIAALIVQGRIARPDMAVIIDTEREKQTTWAYMDEVITPALKTVGVTLHRVRKSEFEKKDLYGGADDAISATTLWARIFIAGDIEVAKQVCREYCFDVGLCVTVEPADYIYTGGQEAGMVIGLINYPRFPVANQAELDATAEALALRVMERCCQHSFTIMGPLETRWFSRRPE